MRVLPVVLLAVSLGLAGAAFADEPDTTGAAPPPSRPRRLAAPT